MATKTKSPKVSPLAKQFAVELKKLKDLCHSYDVYWEMSDDSSVHSRGSDIHNQVFKLAKVLRGNGLDKEVEAMKEEFPMLISAPNGKHALGGECRMDIVEQRKKEAEAEEAKRKAEREEAARLRAATDDEKAPSKPTRRYVNGEWVDVQPTAKNTPQKPTQKASKDKGAEDPKAIVLRRLAKKEITKEKAEELLRAIDLLGKLGGTGVQKNKVARTAKPHDGEVFGFSPCSVLRWMGKEGWSYKMARAAIDKALEDSETEIAENTIRLALGQGRRGERGEPAPLTAAQAKKLLSFTN